MADDAKPARIRWHEEAGTGVLVFTGTVGTVDRTLFSIFITEGEHDLATSLYGMEAKRYYGTDEEVKAEAERWLEEHGR